MCRLIIAKICVGGIMVLGYGQDNDLLESYQQRGIKDFMRIIEEDRQQEHFLIAIEQYP